MNRILFILAFFAFVSCANEEKEIVDPTDDTEKKDDIPIVNGFGCEVKFNEEGYVIKVSKDNNLLFEVSEDIGKGSKQYRNNIRLYCLRLSDNMLIIGNGDVKDANTWQDSPILSRYVQLLIETSRFINSRKQNDQIRYKNKILEGNLRFKTHEKE